MILCFYVHLRFYTTSFMDSLLTGTQIGGIDLRPRDRAAERPVWYLCSDLVDLRESRLK